MTASIDEHVKNLALACATLPPEAVANTIASVIAMRPDREALRQAAVVRLINTSSPIKTYGELYADTLTDANKSQRLTYSISPFARITGGAVCVILANDANGETNVLLEHF